MERRCSSVCLACQEEQAISRAPSLAGGIWHSIRLLTVYEPITEGKGFQGREGGCAICNVCQ